MRIKKRVKVLLIISGVMATSSFAYGALYGFGPAETWTKTQLTQLVASVNSDIASFGSSFGAQIETTFETLLSAVAIATKQESLSGSTVSDSVKQAAEQFLNAQTTQNTNNQVTEAWVSYSGATGQGFDPCGTMAKNKSLDKVFANSRDIALNGMNKSDNAPGRLVNKIDALNQRMAIHREKFCTASEAAAGLCSNSDLPGGDSNGALLFTPVDDNSLASEGRAAFIQNVLGDPDSAVSAKAGKTAAGQAYALSKSRKDALISIPSYSLNSISASNTRSADFDNQSPNEMLQARVNQYFGGKEAEQWAAALSHQSPRGLLVEGAKMEGMESWINYRNYLQNQRLIANFAALQIAAVAPMQAQLDKQSSDLMRVNAISQIK